MSNVSKAVGQDYRGLGIPDPRFVYSSSNVTGSFSQANPRPGVAIPSQKSGLVLETSGKFDNIVTLDPSLTIKVVKGGIPGHEEASFTFTPNFSVSGSYEQTFGWDPNNALNRNELIYNSATDGDVENIITLQDNTLLLGIRDGDTFKVVRKTFDTASYAANGTVKWSWGSPITVSHANTDRRVLQQHTLCFFQLPEGRIIAYYAVKDKTITGDEFGQVMSSHSDDNGVTWTMNDTYCLEDSIPMFSVIGAGNDGYDITRMKCAYANGQTLILIGGIVHNTTTHATVETCLWQYASADLGVNFKRIALGGTSGELSDTGTGSRNIPGLFDIAATNANTFVVVYNSLNTVLNLGQPTCKILSNAFFPWISTTAPTSALSSVTSMGQMNGANKDLKDCCSAITKCDDGVLLASFANDITGKSYVSFSSDNGVTWNYNRGNAAVATTESTWWYTGSARFFPSLYAITFQCGRMVVVSQFYTQDPENQDNSIPNMKKYFEMDVGGYTTTTRPFKFNEEYLSYTTAWELNWLPGQRIRDTTGWTFAGTGTETLGTEYTNTVTVGGQNISIINPSPAAATANGLVSMGQFEAKCNAGTGNFELIVGDGANFIQVWFMLGVSNARVWDNKAAAFLYDAAAPNQTGYNQFLWCYDWVKSRISVWVRDSNIDMQVRPWKQIVDYVAVSKAAGATASSIKVFQASNTDMYWRNIHFAEGLFARPMFRTSAANADGFYDKNIGRNFSVYPINIYAGDGVRLKCVDGPGVSGDTFVINQRHEFDISNVFQNVSPSPAKTWRSTGLTQQDILVTLDISGDPGALMGSVLVLGAFNCNFRELQVSYRNTVGAGGWTSLGNINFFNGQSGLKWVRDGHVIRPDTSAGSFAVDYFTYNILEDSHVLITNNASSAVRTISTNSEGSWSDTTLVRPRLYCVDILSTDGASGTSGEIWSRDGVLFIHDVPDICQLKFTIPAGTTAEGYYEIGNLFFGHLAYFGKQYARGRALSSAQNTLMTTGRGGTRRSQVQSKPRRGVEFSWANENETDMSRLTSSSTVACPNPDYILPAVGSTNPVATPADTGYKMMGLVDYLRGVDKPVIYLSKVPMVSNENVDTLQVNRQLFMLGRLMGDVRIESILGDEWSTSGEVTRISTVSFEEEL